MLDIIQVVQELKGFLSVVEKIISNEDLEDKYKFDAVFSQICFGEIKILLSRLGITLDYYDPDEDYMDDLLAYKNALQEVVNPLFESLIHPPVRL